MAITSKQKIRSAIRQKRQSLSQAEQQQAAWQLVDRLFQIPIIRFAKHFACYSTNDGELSTTPLIERLWASRKTCALPAINTFGRRSIRFHYYHQNSKIAYNRYNILEPRSEPHLPLLIFDIIFMPLVAFDNNGNRLGMGAGYYDRSLWPLRQNRQHRRCRLIGLAHDCQYVDAVPADPWDIRLDAVCTPSHFYSFNSKA